MIEPASDTIEQGTDGQLAIRLITGTGLAQHVVLDEVQRGFGVGFRSLCPHHLPGADDYPEDKRHCHRCRRTEHEFVPPKGLLEFVGRSRWTGHDRLVVQMPLQVGGKTVGRVVTALAILLQALHYDPVEVALEQRDRLLHS